MTDRSLQNSIAVMCFAMVTIVAGAWTLEAGRSVVASYQQRQAEALCKVDPSYCGVRR